MAMKPRWQPANWPWLHTFLFLFGVFAVAAALATMPFLLAPLTVAAMVWSVCTWMVHFDGVRAGKLHGHWLSRPVIDWVCAAEGVPPVFESLRPETLIRPRTDADWAAVAMRLKAEVWGHNDKIDKAIAAFRASVLLRDSLKPSGPLPPIGAHLFVGREALGKLTLARALGAELYGTSHVHVVDAAGRAEDVLADLAQLATDHVGGIIILENFERSTDTVRERMLAIMAGKSIGVQNGAAAGLFRNWSFFCLSHIDATELDTNQEQGLTTTHAALVRFTGLPLDLLVQFSSTLSFVLPGEDDSMRVIGKMFQDACLSRSITLVRVSDEVIFKEVELAAERGSYAIVYPRVRHRAEAAIAKALAEKRATVEIA